MLIEKYKKGDMYIEIHTDDCPDNPRENGDWAGVMSCWHRRYILGDNQPDMSPQEYLKNEIPEGSVVLPLYLMDHSGISMSTGSFGCPWDSGQVGYIFMTPETREKEGLSKEGAKEHLNEEVKIYDQYLKGEVYGFRYYRLDPCDTCGHPEEVEEDSGWGFYGAENTKEALAEDHDIKWEEWEEVGNKS